MKPDPTGLNVPRHYQVTANEFRRLIQLIQTAFINRPVPKGDTIANFVGFLDGISDRIASTLESIPPAVESVSNMLALPESKVGIDQVAGSTKQLAAAVNDLIQILHMIWKRPFPREFADGQPLVSAILERPLRDLLKFFEAIVEVVEDPDAAAKKYGDKHIDLDITLQVTEELAACIKWAKNAKIRTVRLHQYQARKKDDSFVIPLLAFLLGMWTAQKPKE